ncbi:uncharacterized protein LOC131236770 isoform X2 [Magnolia sinica]|uniref:uncharacterized protein LOC131236770 isoform X2 n=1 Tax=Magnolia sinica TaxID=86752 RepID=UPI00265B6CDA|nr:uncharacterized protein LOC131236770 isoform X2 [Magnolia sinica]
MHPFGMAISSFCRRKSAFRSCGVWRKSMNFFPEQNSTRQIVKEDKALLYEDWKESIAPLIANGAFKLDPTNFGIEQYFAARSLVSSRSFEVDDYHGFGMVPLADLFNHKTGAENVHFFSTSPLSGSDNDNDNDSDNQDVFRNNDGDKPSNEGLDTDTSDHILNQLDPKRSMSSTVAAGQNFLDSNEVYHSDSGDEPAALEMGVVKGVKAGDEVFNTYGSMGNAALLHRYGFTELGNQFDIVNIELNLVIQWILKSFSSRYCRARLSLWRRLDYSGCTSENSEYFEISYDGEPELELLILLYIVFLPEEAYQKLNCTVSSIMDVDKPMNILLLTKNSGSFLKTQEETKELLLTGGVRHALVSLANIRESLYGLNSLEDDMNALKKCCHLQERKLYHSLVLRISERMILKKLRLNVSRSCKKRKRKL